LILYQGSSAYEWGVLVLYIIIITTKYACIFMLIPKYRPLFPPQAVDYCIGPTIHGIHPLPRFHPVLTHPKALGREYNECSSPPRLSRFCREHLAISWSLMHYRCMVVGPIVLEKGLREDFDRRSRNRELFRCSCSL